jgi:hypothetical protein
LQYNFVPAVLAKLAFQFLLNSSSVVTVLTKVVICFWEKLPDAAFPLAAYEVSVRRSAMTISAILTTEAFFETRDGIDNARGYE